jgi:thioredoxin 1
LKKLIIFVSIIVVIFGALAFLTTYQNKQKAEGNPYGKAKLDSATIGQLDDPLYQNQILPDDLKQRLDDGESLTVYFYSPTCVYCQQTTPIVGPLTEELGIDLKRFNLLEFEDGWDDFNIESTPTMIHFVDGKEEKRVVGLQEEEVFKSWLSDIKVE